jgi:hypothetical protein
MKTTDYDMINEFAIIHFPSNTVSKNRQGEGLGDEKEKIAQQDSEKKRYYFLPTPIFSLFFSNEVLGRGLVKISANWFSDFTNNTSMSPSSSILRTK